ncbi:hypothetical protein CC80DRAFT_246529 [Byssothecium circinans]|uniref:Uncharacterized protein n=1 Tax=Byssothecium circinans TaxID=147558 RepID=A0A6A5TDA5_9PLEO|nr:hypothetical protein CC80DRAFT_246529 [Byssothecium circinans]
MLVQRLHPVFSPLHLTWNQYYQRCLFRLQMIALSYLCGIALIAGSSQPDWFGLVTGAVNIVIIH